MTDGIFHEKDEQASALWMMRMFTLVALDGVWVVPRSGLTYRKSSIDPPTFELIDVVPSSGKQQLVQRMDHDAISTVCEVAGITVIKREGVKL